MRYQLFDHQNNLMLDTDELEDVADELGVKAQYLYVRLSAGKGTFSSGKARNATTLKDTGRKERGASDGARGPTRTDYRYAATYPDEFPDTFRLPTHEVTLEEVMRVMKLSRDQLMQKFASHQKVQTLIEASNSYRFEPVVFKRLKPTPELDAIPCEPQPVIDKRPPPPRPQAGKAPPSASPKRSSQVVSARSKK